MDTPMSTGSFYGKKLRCPQVQVKVTKLSASEFQYYLGKLPTKTTSECISEYSGPKRKILPVISSEATRHNIKPLSGGESRYEKLELKVTKLSASELQYYLGKLPTKTTSECKSKYSRPKRKILPVIGSEATRHNIKPLSGRKRKRKVKPNEKLGLMPLSCRKSERKVKQRLGLKNKSKEECSNVRKTPRKASALVLKKRYMNLNSDCSDDEEESEDTENRHAQRSAKDCSDDEEESEDTHVFHTENRHAQRSAKDSWKLKRGSPLEFEERKNYGRKAAAGAKDKIAKAYKGSEDEDCSDDEEESDDTFVLSHTENRPARRTHKENWKFKRGIPLEFEERKNYGRKAAAGAKDKITKAYKGSEDEESSDSYSNFSSSDDEKFKKSKKPAVKKVNPKNIPTPELSDYEKAVQEKVSLRMEFLKSLKIHSL